MTQVMDLLFVMSPDAFFNGSNFTQHFLWIPLELFKSNLFFILRDKLQNANQKAWSPRNKFQN